MQIAHKSPSTKRTLAIRVAVGFTAILGIASIYAFRAVFSRPGEQALSLLPANAIVVGSIDLNPSPEQALTFKTIDDSLERNGVKEPFQRSVLDMVEQSPAAQPIRELTTRSFAFGLIPGDGKDQGPDPVLLMPLTNGDVADHILRTKGVSEFWKGTPYFRLPNSHSGMMVIGNTLVIAQKPNALHEVAEVSTGQLPSITSNADYVKARAQEASDANLMVFGTPAAMQMIAPQKSGSKMTGWISASLTIEDTGLALTTHGNYQSDDPAINQIHKIAPLRADLAQILPEGAYGIIAISQPAKYWGAIESGLKSTDSKKPVDDMKRSLAKETSLDADTDIEPGFMGDSILAAYPSEDPAAGVDFLLVADDQNGATPSALADKFQAYVDRRAAESKDMGSAWFTKIDRSDAEAYRLSDKVQSKLEESMHGGKNDPIRYDTLFGHKTVAWAKVKGAVMLSTSQALLNRAADAYEGKGASLATEPAMKKAADPGENSQLLAAFSITRIAQGIRNTAIESKMSDSSRKTFDQAIATFSGLSIPLQMKSNSSSGSLFIPMDYQKMIDLFGNMSAKH